MDKITDLQQIQELLDTIAEKMSLLKTDINAVSACLKAEKLISEEVSKRLIEKLQELNSLSSVCLKRYEASKLPISEDRQIQKMRNVITQRVNELELNKKLAKYRRFLALTSDDQATSALLEKYKETVQKLLREYAESMEGQLLPYSDFVDALEEPNDYKRTSYMISLAGTFDTTLLTDAFFKKSIYRKQEDQYDYDTATEAESLVKISDCKEITELPDAFLSTDKNTDKQQPDALNSDDAADTDTNIITQVATECISDEIDQNNESGLLLTKESFDQNFELEKGSEEKPVGSKSCVNDLKNKYPTSMACVMLALDQFGTISPEMVAILSKGIFGNVVLALDYLKQKGYVRKYKVNGIGSFYCTSPKGQKALAKKEVRKYLKLGNASTSDPGERLEQDTVYAALARIAFVKFATLYLNKLPTGQNFSQILSTEYFHAIVGSSREYAFSGIFWTSMEEAEGYCTSVESICNKYPYKSFLLIGLNAEITRNIAVYLIKRMSLDQDKLFCYSLLEKTYVKYETNEPAVFDDLFETVDPVEPDGRSDESSSLGECTDTVPKLNKEGDSFDKNTQKNTLENKLKEESTPPETQKEEPSHNTQTHSADACEALEITSDWAFEPSNDQSEVPAEYKTEDSYVSDTSTSAGSAVKETSAAKNAVKEVTVTKDEHAEKESEVKTPAPDEPTVDRNAENEASVTNFSEEVIAEIDMDEVMGNTYQMIADGKLYCATAYLRALSISSTQAKKAYEQLAYAVNDPAMMCSYSSHKIFSLYSESESEFSKYLMLSTSMRNFFLSHTGYEYDYQMKSLYESMNASDLAGQCPNLLGAAYDMLDFKERFHNGIDSYADYRLKDQNAVKKRLNELTAEAKVLYETCVKQPPRNHKHVKRFVETWKLALSDGDMALYLNAVIENDYDSAAFVQEYLLKNFINDNCSAEYSNLSIDKLEQYIDDCWDRSKISGGNRFKSSNLMSDLRNNLKKALEKVLRLLCEWSDLLNTNNVSTEDAGAQRYKEIRKDLMKKLTAAMGELNEKQQGTRVDEQAGAEVLKTVVHELMARIDGSYDERSHKYYYMDFLRGNYVLLDEEYLPDMHGKFVDFQEFSMANRVLEHCGSKLMTFQEMLDHIFLQYGDNYGSAELIMEYLEDYGDKECRDSYDIKASKEQAQKDAAVRLKNFIEDLELAQSYGQIEETKENKKEKIQKIANEWFEYTDMTQNYGFFKMILKQYKNKIKEEAKVRGETLLKEVESLTTQGIMNEIRQKRVKRIQDMIECQNYTVAEDLLARIDSDEPDEDLEYARQDYLRKFIDEYDYNYTTVANAGMPLNKMVASRVRNKDDKGAKRLIDNWLSSSGQLLGAGKVADLLDALGFTGAKVQEPTRIGKYQSYLVTLPKTIGRNANYKHPIAAFGSKAAESGFRVVCLYGKYDADRLMEEFRNIPRKNTLILLDFALTLPNRRILARKMKEDASDNVFAVLDRVLLMFLVNNYNVQFINQILMSIMMPFSYYQPYIWDSSKVMTPEIFMGRKEELETIESPIGVNMVYGGRQLGKSALLKKAKMDIDHDENNDRAVFIEIKGADYKQAARKIGCDLYLEGVLETQIDTEDWDELGRAIKARLLSKENRIPYLLLLLDEADDFIESCAKVKYRPLDILKDLQNIGSERFKFVIAGLHNVVRFRKEALSHNSVLPQLRSITIKPFNVKDARKLLEEPLYYMGFRFPQEKQSLVSLILASTNYFPGLIQLYCAKLIEAMKNSYAGYEESTTPAYEVNPDHIKKVLAAPDFMDQVREKFEITLKLDEDNMYYIIALLMAYLYYQNANSATESNGFSAQDIIEAARSVDIKKVADQRTEVIEALMDELLELNILRRTVQKLYLFSRYSFFQMMGTSDEIEDKLLGYMED